MSEQLPDMSLAAERLNACIEKFEQGVNRHPQRAAIDVDVSAWPQTSQKEEIQRIAVRREGKAWKVFVYLDNRWVPAREAGIDVKLQLVGMLPRLIPEFQKAREDLVKRIHFAVDQFNDSLPSDWK